MIDTGVTVNNLQQVSGRIHREPALCCDAALAALTRAILSWCWKNNREPLQQLIPWDCAKRCRLRRIYAVDKIILSFPRRPHALCSRNGNGIDGTKSSTALYRGIP